MTSAGGRRRLSVAANRSVFFGSLLLTAVSAGLPLCLILLGICATLIWALRHEGAIALRHEGAIRQALEASRF